jgi:hypothetical protein
MIATLWACPSPCPLPGGEREWSIMEPTLVMG